MIKDSFERHDQRSDSTGNRVRADARARPVAVQRDRMVEARSAVPVDDGPVVYDVPEVIRRLGVTRPTVYRFLMSGELRSFRLGSRRLVSAEALADFIRSREAVEAS